LATPIIRMDDTQLQVGLAKEPEREAEALGLFQERGSLLTMAEMRLFVPVGKTGFLRESITRRFTQFGFSVYPTMPYSEAVDKGTGPHVIFPSKAKVLRWTNELGAVFYAKYVKHPGFPGRFYVQRTLEAVRDRLVDLSKQIWRQLHG